MGLIFVIQLEKNYSNYCSVASLFLFSLILIIRSIWGFQVGPKYKVSFSFVSYIKFFVPITPSIIEIFLSSIFNHWVVSENLIFSVRRSNSYFKFGKVYQILLFICSPQHFWCQWYDTITVYSLATFTYIRFWRINLCFNFLQWVWGIGSSTNYGSYGWSSGANIIYFQSSWCSGWSFLY